MKLNELKAASNPFKDYVDALVASQDTVKGRFSIYDAAIYLSNDSNYEPLPSTATPTEVRIDMERRFRFRFTAKEDGTVTHLLRVTNNKPNAKDNGITSDSGTACDISFITVRNALNASRIDLVHDAVKEIDEILATESDELQVNKKLTKLLRGMIISFVQTPLCDKDTYIQYNGKTWKPQPNQYSVITEIVSVDVAANAAE